jgi:hypothetical protein
LTKAAKPAAATAFLEMAVTRASYAKSLKKT